MAIAKRLQTPQMFFTRQEGLAEKKLVNIHVIKSYATVKRNEGLGGKGRKKMPVHGYREWAPEYLK